MEIRKTYAFIVDTEDYSGNFERSMFAYLTGEPYEYYHKNSEAYAEQAQKELPDTVKNFIQTNLDFQLDDTDDVPTHKNFQIWPTPGWSNDGNGNYTKVGPKGKVLYPAYLSVAIFFTEIPPKNVLDTLADRARKLCREHKDFMGEASPIKFTGCRLVLVENTVTESLVLTL